jgi:hypothetical protein
MLVTGYQIAQDTINEGQEDEATAVTVHGHVLIGIDEVEPLPDDIKNLRIPGSYWMEGGTLSLQAAGCIDIGAGLKECPFNVATKAEGKFYDICYEIAKLEILSMKLIAISSIGWIAIASIPASGMLITVTVSTTLSSA